MIKQAVLWVKRFFGKKDFKVFEENQHIEDYLDYFIDEVDSPGFSVLINGEWGIGKTWFINEYLSNRDSKESLQIVKISLYGLNTVDEINAEIFQAIHPGKHKFKNGFISKIVSSSAKSNIFGFQVDLSDFMPNGQYELDQDKEYILLFDDFERSHISTQLLMGYLNDFVEIQKQKVILVGNESKLVSDTSNTSTNGSDEFSYKNIKEKLIGKTLLYRPNYRLAISSFIRASEIKNFLQSNEIKIFRVFEQANYKNLRQIKSSLQDFERIYKAVIDDGTKDKEIVKQLLVIYLSLDLEYKNQNISSSQIETFPEVLYLDANGEELISKDDVTKSLEKYSLLSLTCVESWILSPQIWKQLIVDGYIDQDTIKAALKDYIDGNQPDWLKLVHFRIFNDSSFEGFIFKVNERLDSSYYKELGEVKHIFSTMFVLSSAEVISESLDDLMSKAKSYIDGLASSGYLDKKSTTIDLHGDDSYGGFIYSNISSPSYKELDKYIENKLFEVSKKIQKEKAVMLEKNPLNTVITGYEDDELFDHISLPFLQYINPKAFVTNTLDKSFSEVSGIATFITGRYHFFSSGSYSELSIEKDFINQCLVLYQSEKSNSNRTISRLNSGYFEDAFVKAQKDLQACNTAEIE